MSRQPPDSTRTDALVPSTTLFRSRDRHSTRLGKPLDAGRHVHAVAIEIAAVHHDVAEVDADAQDDALVHRQVAIGGDRSEEHTSELQSLMRISYAVFCLKKKNKTKAQ